ncbi:hypothetical protein [Aquimarina sp. SS2-1]|uniref:hypothetical protein n=1 Tax=Aquimarina besae TaxID=3342247 RepID=UPI00366ACB8B
MLNETYISNSNNSLRIKPKIKLKDLVSGAYQNSFTELNKKAGVYIFWWTGDQNFLKSELLKAQYKLKGPHIKNSENNHIDINFTREWINSATHNDNLCLYVGKSTNIRQRVLGHIKYTNKNIWGDNNGPNFGRKPNTVSQLRIGIERVFGRTMIEEILKSVSLSWIELEGIENVINRFYLENKLIGDLYPLFNIDAER